MRRSVACPVGMLLLAVLLAACGAVSQGPMAWLDQPLDGSSYPLGPITIQAHASDADGVASIEFFVDSAPLTTVSVGGGRLADAMVEWNPTQPGTYSVRARATDSQGNVGGEATSVVTVGDTITPSPTTPVEPEGREIIFAVEPDVVPSGGCGILRWEVNPPSEALLDGEAVPPAGEREVCPPETRSYELLVPETGEVGTATLHVEPAPEGELAMFFAVNPDVIPAGGCTMLLWEVAAPEEWRVLVDGEVVPHVGEREECPPATTTYELLVEAVGGPEMRTVTLHVEGEPEPTTPPEPPPEPTPEPEPTSPSGCPGPPVISSFTANPSTITAGQSSTLKWGRVTNGNSDVLVRSVVINPGLGEVGSPGSRVVSPQATTTYALVATGCGGVTQKQVTVTVNPDVFSADLAITDLRAVPPSLEVHGDITNHGPGTVTNVTVQLSCQWSQRDPIEGTTVDAGQTGLMPISIGNLSAGQTQVFNTDITVQPSQYQVDFSCSIQVPFNDPNPGNNTHSEQW